MHLAIRSFESWWLITVIHYLLPAVMLASSIGTYGRDATPVFACDLIEVNHVYSHGTGAYRFSQVIAWDFVDGKWKVQGWATIDRNECANI